MWHQLEFDPNTLSTCHFFIHIFSSLVFNPCRLQQVMTLPILSDSITYASATEKQDFNAIDTSPNFSPEQLLVSMYNVLVLAPAIQPYVWMICDIV